MVKIITLTVLIALAAAIFWISRLPGSALLDFSDRLYPLGESFTGEVVEDIEFDAATNLRLDIFQPSANGPHPVLIFFYGGSWQNGSRKEYGFAGRAFAARGFTTIIADYRKVPQVHFPAYVEDAAAAVAWTHNNIAEHGGDPKRIFTMGHSAGAHIAMLVTLDPRWLKAHGADPEIIAGIIGVSGPYNFFPYVEGREADQAMGKWPKQEETQPINFAHANAPPMLLLSGEADTTVNPRNAITLQNALKDVGASSQVKLYEGRDHTDPLMAIAKPFRSRAPVIDDAVAFMRGEDKGSEVK